MLNIKVAKKQKKTKKKKNLFIFLATYMNLSENYGNLGFFFFSLKSSGSFFSMKNPLYRWKSTFFFSSKCGKILPPKIIN